MFFFRSDFLKVHLKIKEIRFLGFPDRCGGPEKSYEPETKKTIWGLFSIFWSTFLSFFKEGRKNLQVKKMSRKKSFEKNQN